MKYNYLREKKKNVIKRLRDLNYLPEYGSPMNDEQQEIYEQIKNGNFDIWEKIKENNNWSNEKKSDDEHKLTKKRQNIKYKLKSKGFIPKDDSELNEEHLKIIEQINNNDFSYYYSVIKK